MKFSSKDINSGQNMEVEKLRSVPGEDLWAVRVSLFAFAMCGGDL